MNVMVDIAVIVEGERATSFPFGWQTGDSLPADWEDLFDRQVAATKDVLRGLSEPPTQR